jgi:hypothetical protein
MPQNFQNWQSLGFDAAPQSPTSPSGIPGTEFQDWANLSGPSDILKKMSGIQKPSGWNNSAAPVAPPQNWGQAMDQAIAPFQQKIENVTNAFGQLGQGDTFGAYASLKGQKPMVGPQPQQPQAAQEDSGFNFSRH